MRSWHIHMCHYGLLSATHVHSTYEFVTHSCITMAPYRQHMYMIRMGSWHIHMCHKTSFLNRCGKSSLFRVTRKVWPLISNTCRAHVWVRDTFMCHYGPLSATHVDHTYEFVTHSCVTQYLFSTGAESRRCFASSANYGPLSAVASPCPLLAIFTFSRRYLYKNICIWGIYVHSYRYIHHEIYI